MDTNRKKIAFFIINMGKGGAERFLSLLLERISNHFDIHLLLLENKIEYYIPSQVKVKILRPQYPQNSLFKLLYMPVYTIQLFRFLKKNQIKLLISFLGFSNFSSSLLKLVSKKINIIISERIYPLKHYEFGWHGIIGRKLIKKTYQYADLVIPNSIQTKQSLLKDFGIKIPQKVIYNLVDEKYIKNKIVTIEPKVTNIKSSEFVFIHIGRFNKQKNHLLLINAFSKIQFSAQLWLIGEGEELPNVKELIKRKRLDSKVKIWGLQDNPFQFLTSSDCFVLTSNYEGFPNVLLEALACNVPIISTDCLSGPRELLSPNSDISFQLTHSIEIADYGILTPVDDVDSLAQAMEKMYYANELRQQFIEKSRQRVKDFQPNRILNDWIDTINNYV